MHKRLRDVKKIGLVVNPIAGMGGRVGLKGTDGEEILKKAVELGARPISLQRASKTLELIDAKNAKFFTCSGEMGEDELKNSGQENFEIVCSAQKPSTSKDTENACQNFMEIPVDIILFCGGDGTARDVFRVVNAKIPIIGIPSGVKMHSAVFAKDPESAAQLINLFIEGQLSPRREAEVVDIDEERYREDILQVKIFGHALTLHHELVQVGKAVIEGEYEDEVKTSIAKYILEEMGDEVYIVGPGTTTKKLFDFLGLDKTLLGIDIIREKKLIKKDANENDLLDILAREKKCKIIISPIGAQGFLFGRGNQQISSDVIKRIGIENIITIATPYKLSKTSNLKVDTDDEGLNEKLRGYRRVITGYHGFAMKKVE